ncbi:ABI family, member 3 (NESH) binding protein b [Aulostomus maculatus]
MAAATPLLRGILLLLTGTNLLSCILAQQLRVQRQNMKVWIHATGDTIVMKFVPQSPDVKLEGYILGYGSSVFSKHFIPLPENGEPYQSEMDAEPRYLVAVQPLQVNNVKKHCTGKLNLVKPLHLVLSSIRPTMVLLSWGDALKTPYNGSIFSDCLEDGSYTVRYRERNRKWIYRTCPTSNTVIDSLKPDTTYEFGVRSNKDERSGSWSKVVIHNSNMAGKKPPGGLALFPPRPGSPARPPTTYNKKTNLDAKPGQTDKSEQTNKLLLLNPKVAPVTAKPDKQENKHPSSEAPTLAASHQETWEDSDLFKSQPTSDLDVMGKKRYVAPHVVYQTGKKPDEPCSITSSLNYFPGNEPSEAHVTAPPRSPPSNLTVVTVEGCPSFIILDWEKTDNSTTEYEIISTTKGPDGEQVSILTTNQTHTAVENLKPESSYEFKVKPKNDLGAGPLSEPVSFNTESANPRVSENVSGKDAIWTQFPFTTDSFSDCHGKQFVKRTWYRKYVGVQLCNSLRYKIYLSDSLNGPFYNIGDQTGFGEDHCQFVDSFLDGRTGHQLRADQLPSRHGYYRALRQEPVRFGEIGGRSHVSYVSWYECGTPIPGKW